MKNILKVRDDHTPITFESKNGSSEEYSVCSDSPKPTWVNDGSFSVNDLRNRIEPWLTSLFQSEHLSLLIGSGLSTGIQYIASPDNASNNGMGKPELKEDCPYADKIHVAAAESARSNGRGDEGNIEDYFRVMNDLMCGLEIIGEQEAHQKLRTEYNDLLNKFVAGISAGESCIISSDEKKRIETFNILTTFLMSFSSRTGTRDRLNIFTTNYDRVIEAGAEISGLHLIDRFVGNLSPIFRSSRLDIDMHYNPPGMRGEPRYLEGVARYTKLHGSIDWIEANKEIRRIGLPFGATNIESFINSPGFFGVDHSKIMIYPNSSKDRETSEYPYVELFRDFAAALCRPNSTLVIYGYSFGDDHINRIIRDMLTIPSTHVVIISYDDEQRRIKNFYADLGRASQVSLIIGKDLADIRILTENFLPKPAIDRTTIRMAELLKQRHGPSSDESNKPTFTEGGAEK